MKLIGLNIKFLTQFENAFQIKYKLVLEESFEIVSELCSNKTTIRSDTLIYLSFSQTWVTASNLTNYFQDPYIRLCILLKS